MSKRNAIIFIIILLGSFCVYLFTPTAPTPPPLHPKILFTNFHPEFSGGHLTYIRSIIKSDLKQYYSFAVAAPETSDIFAMAQGQNINAYACDFPGKLTELPRMIKSIIRFRKICNSFEPDIIHTNGGHDNTIAIWGSFFLKKKPRIVRTFHGIKVISKDPYHWLLYNHLTDTTLFVSPEALDYNATHNGLHLNNAVVIENCVNLYHFAPISPDEALRQALAIPQDAFIFGSCAGLADYKRVDLMLQAAHALKDKYNFKIVVLGDPQNGAALQAQALDLGLENIFFYAGYHKDIRPYCSLFDVGFILSDRVETISFAAREMMAMGIPLISSSFGGLSHNVDDMKNGRLIKPGNLDELIDAMTYFLELPQNELIQYRENARIKAEEAFSCRKQIQALDRVYRDILTADINYLPTYATPLAQQAP